MKRFFNYIVILAIVLLSSACEFKFKPNEEGEAVPLSVQRYDRLESRYLTTGDFSALQQIGALDQSIVVGEHSVGISLDKYMGENYPLYKKFYTPQQRSTMSRQYIVPDCLTFYLLSIYPMDQFDTRPQLDRDLHMGKIMWAVNKAMGKEIFSNASCR